jgi:hypothetical protein
MGNNYEGSVITRVQLDATAKGWRLFRNSTGQGWQGQITEEYTLTERNGRPVHVVELTNARRVAYGLTRGSSDLIGWRPVIITTEMVGQTIAQFVAVECKTERYRRTTEEQDNFLGQVAGSGGAAYLARGDGTAEVDLIAVESD